MHSDAQFEPESPGLGARFLRWLPFPERDASGRDMALFALTMLLAFAGLVILYSASAVVAERELDDADYFFMRQIGWLGAGLISLFFFALLPPALLRRLALPMMLGAMLLLLLVFVPGLGHSVASTRDSFHRWLRIGPIVFQPSEFAKVAMVVYLAHVLSRNDRLESEFDMRRLLAPLGLVGAVLALIVLEPQYGTTLCMLGVIVLTLYISGFPMLRLALLFLAALPLLALLLVLWEYRLERFNVWLDPYAYRYEGGYQLVTSFRAFREGGWLGVDLASGFSHRYLTYGHTDFVLALFAEDFGWLGVLALLGLFAAFLWRAVLGVRAVKDPFLFLLGAGSLAMLLLQALLNMFVVTGIVPTTGVSLPFISYGGSSFIVTLAFCGLLLNVSRGSDPAA